MNASRFDAIIRLFADRRTSRRTALAAGTSIVAAGLAPAAAQDAIPIAAHDGSPVPSDTAGSFMFVQTFGAGSLAPKDGADDVLILTADHLAGQTLYFSDRHERNVGMVSTARFLGAGRTDDGLGFSPVDPPNAALVFEPAPGETDIIVLELLNPQYDDAADTLIYDVHLLDTFDEEDGLSFQEAPRQPSPQGEEFTAGDLFIDDCANESNCYNSGGLGIGAIPGGPYGTCWSWNGSGCQPNNPNCNGPTQADLNTLCNQTYANQDSDCAQNACYASI
jgi:hypothetical protein